MSKLTSGALNSLRKKTLAPPLPKQIENPGQNFDTIYSGIPEYQVIRSIPGIEPLLDPRLLLMPDLVRMVQLKGPESIAKAIRELGDRPVTDIVFIHESQDLNRATEQQEKDSIVYVGEGIENQNIQCPKCENRLVSSRPSQRARADEPPTYICKCLNPKCKHNWTIKAA